MLGNNSIKDIEKTAYMAHYCFLSGFITPWIHELSFQASNSILVE